MSILSDLLRDVAALFFPPRCPVCGEECETIYRDRFGTYVGCDICMETKDAWEVPECFPEHERSI